jgi:DNA-binding CsgD family transcriptional regulator/PAS domain-containing protein
MPQSIARLSPVLLEQLYLGAAVDDELKPFLSNLAKACNASLATFASMDGRTRRDSMRVTRLDDHRDYAGAVPSYYAERSPFRPLMMLESNFGRVLTSTDMVSPERRRRDVFINEFLKPTDHEYLATGVFARSDDQYNYFVLNRGSRFGEFGEHEVAALRALVPHFRTMLRLRNSMVARDRHVAFSHEMADRNGDGLVLLDRHGRVRSMNERASEMLARDEGLRVTGARLHAANGADNAHLHRAIQQLLSCDAPQVMQPGISVTVRRDSAARPYRLHIMSLVPRKLLFAGDDLEIAVQISERRGRAEDEGGAARQFGLTPAEVCVARHLVSGRSAEQIAVALGNSVNTIRAHRRNLYRKLGVTRHYDMVRLLGELDAARD